MRARLLVAAMLVAPLAAAQVPPSLTLEVAPIGDEVQPLGAPILRPFWVNVTCLAAVPGATPAVHLWLDERPSWATVLVEPAEWTIDPASCAQGVVRLEGILNVSVSDQAPAHTPVRVTLMAAAEGFGRNSTASEDVGFEAAYFSILDVQVEETIKVAPPAGVATFLIRVANLGNGETLVRVVVDGSTGGLGVDPVQDVMLQSRQKGGTITALDVPIVVRTPSGVGYHNEVGIVTLRLLATEEGGAATDVSTVTLVVTTKGLDAPGAALPALLVSALLAAAASRRR